MTVKSCTRAIINQKKEVKSFSLVLLLLFLIVLPSLQLIPKAKANPDWLSGWQYRKSHVINGSTAGEQTNYQVKIVAKYGSRTSTFGKTTVGSSYTGVSGDYKFACRFYLANDGTVTKITWYGRANPMGGSTANVRAGIYSDNGYGAPDALLASSDEVTISTTAQWWEFTLSASLTAGYYWLAIITDSAVYRYHDAGATDQAAYNGDTYSDGFSDPFGSVAAYSNYEISIYATVTFDTGNDTVYLNEHCRTDFGDVRFTDSDGTTLLDYWMEDYASGDNATFWVEIPSIPASPNTTTIYIYYGKSDAATTSNGDNTFLLFDHFEGTSLDSDKWEGITGDVTVSDSVVKLQDLDTGTLARFYSKNSWQYNVAFRCRARFLYNSPYETFGFSTPSSPWDRVYYSLSDTDLLRLQTANEGTSTYTDITPSTSWKIYEATWISNEAKFYIDATLEATHTTNLPDEALRFREAVLRKTAGTNAGQETDWVLIRKYVDPEPSHGSWGSEEKFGQWHDISAWTFNLVARKWFDVASWNFNVSALQWHDVSVWSFNLAAKAWHNIVSWSFNLLTREWREIAVWNFNLITKTWNTVAQRSFQLATRTWHNIAEWSFNLITHGWHTITHWILTVSTTSIPTLFIGIIFTACILFLVIGLALKKRS